MPFPFSHVSDLLQRLEDNRLARSGVRTNASLIYEWFRAHRALLARDDHASAPLLSALLPEKRTDRVYFIREKKLQTIIGRALGLGRSRIAELGRWTNPAAGVDLAECVEGILRQTPNPGDNPVTVEEIDQLLHRIAAACRFSSPAVRGSAGNQPADQELSIGSLYQRVSARDAKWLTRLILKNYEPLVLDLRVVCSGYHPLLPAILKVQDDLAVAGRILDSLKRGDAATETDLAEHLKPALGVKVGRQTWLKGRSIKHCLSMLQGRFSCEEKMDGEYCQIHIDLSKGHNCIQIFSKSGKDSTKDRFALHDSIRKSLQLGQPSCPLKQSCILEGELVVYSDKDHKVLDFHKIRKHVSRSGSFLGTDQDSPPHPWEHLMIVYYDVLMVDQESLLAVQHSKRFQRLKDLITLIPGRSSIVKREVLDCTRSSARSDLRRAFAKCITARGEGLVLKADDPYFDFATQQRPYRCCAIKLKKESIGHFGEIGDFAVVGARFDPTKARTYTNIRNLKWTHFYLGCLENKEEVQRFGKQPQFVVTNVVELNAVQLASFVSAVNPESVLPEDNTAIRLRIEPGIDGGKRPSLIFPTPPVFDLRCFSFDKEGNTGFWSPRFPTVAKIHTDRTYHDTISFSELQDMANREREMPPPDDSQELLRWIAALEQSDRCKGMNVPSQSTTISSSPTSAGAHTPQSPRCSLLPGNQAARQARSPQPQPQKPAPKPATRTPLAAHPPGSRPLAEVAPSLLAGAAKIKEGAAQIKEGRKRLLELGPSSHVEEAERSKIRRRSPSRGAYASFSSSLSPDTAKQPNTAKQPIAAGQADATGMLNSSRDTVDGLVQCGASLIRRVGTAAAGDLGVVDDGLDGGREKVPSGHVLVSNDTDNDTNGSGHTNGLGNGNSNKHDNNNSSANKPNKQPPTCRLLGTACKIQDYSFLLAPCIADYPWVTDDMLRGHGVTQFLRDPREWANSAAADHPNRHGHNQTQSNKPTPQTKIILVDRRRVHATKTFLRSVEAARLHNPRTGKREWVPVYDWHVLGALCEEERKMGNIGGASRQSAMGRLEVGNAAGVWRRFWVGLA
ncbi:hypothetical protein B0J18DRAFT_366022 [Chaetomium sp. MPI-SDFR-AT-0129]|nr:hypothetical protein B0J18DRAFT_366022 [Chaetomium sp. MPI-SDFR-AT-0129]